jgi:hypothetical protein
MSGVRYCGAAAWLPGVANGRENTGCCARSRSLAIGVCRCGVDHELAGGSERRASTGAGMACSRSMASVSL